MSEPAYAFRGLPLTPAIIETIVTEKIENGEWLLFRRRYVTTEVVSHHLQRGGIPGSDNPIAAVKKALANLKARGLLENPTYGQYRATTPGAAPAPAIVIPPAQSTAAPRIPVQRRIGSGEQAVYVYFYPNDQALALTRKLDRWECKIGMSTVHPEQRVAEQISGTATHALPIIGLIIFANEAAALEQAIHGMLRYAGRQIRPSSGSEWFLTSPEEVERVYEMLQTIS